MAKRQASLLSFCQSTHKRQRESEEKADDDQDQESDDSDHQDVQVEDSSEESELESEHSWHDPSHMMSTLRPPFFGDLSAPEVANHKVLADPVVGYFECDYITQAELA